MGASRAPLEHVVGPLSPKRSERRLRRRPDRPLRYEHPMARRRPRHRTMRQCRIAGKPYFLPATLLAWGWTAADLRPHGRASALRGRGSACRPRAASGHHQLPHPSGRSLAVPAPATAPVPSAGGAMAGWRADGGGGQRTRFGTASGLFEGARSCARTSSGPTGGHVRAMRKHEERVFHREAVFVWLRPYAVEGQSNGRNPLDILDPLSTDWGQPGARELGTLSGERPAAASWEAGTGV